MSQKENQTSGHAAPATALQLGAVVQPVSGVIRAVYAATCPRLGIDEKTQAKYGHAGLKMTQTTLHVHIRRCLAAPQ